MANKPVSKNEDPAALAFSAVENALRESVFSEPAAKAEPKTGRDASEKNPAPASDRMRSASKIAAKTSGFANDDRFVSSKLLYGMQSRASALPLVVAALVSAAWVSIMGIIGWGRYQEHVGTTEQASSFFNTMDFATLIALVTLPVFGIFAIAILARRMQDLRNAATSMTQAAVRLTDPETTAAEKVATVGQAVRREVNALGDGLERALSRAGELEVMVHNEVTSLERTYTENEARLRALIQELADQRDAVINNAERVRDAISGAHTQLVSDLDHMGNTISSTITDRGTNVRESIEKAAGKLDDTFGGRAESFVSLIDNRTTDLVAALDDSTNRFSTSLEENGTGLNSALDMRTMQLSDAFETRMSELTAALDTRSSAITDAIENKTLELSTTLQTGGSQLIGNLEEHGFAMSGALEAIGSRIVSDISDRSQNAERVLSSLTGKLDETMSVRINALESRFQSALIEISSVMDESGESARLMLRDAGSESISSLSARMEEVSVVLDARMNAMDAIIGDKGEKLITTLDGHALEFSNRANLLESALDEKTATLGSAIEDKTNLISNAIEAKTRSLNNAIDERTAAFTVTIDEKAQSLGDTLDNRSESFVSAINEKTQSLNTAIEEGTTVFAEAIDEKTQSLGNALGGQTRNFAEKIATRTQQLSEAIGTRTKEFGDALGSRTQKLSEAVSHETQNLSSVLEQHTNVLSENLAAKSQELAQTIDGHGATIEGRLSNVMQNVNAAMEARTTELSDQVTSKISDINTNIGNEIDNAVARLSDAESGVTARLDSAASKIGENARRAAETIEFGVEHARNSITDMVDKRLGTLPEAITARAEITADRLAELNESLNSSISKSMVDLERGADRIEETISTRISQATLSMSSDVEQTAARMDVAVRTALVEIKEAARYIEDLVEVKAVHTAAELGAQVVEMQQAVSTQSENFAQLIDAKSEQLNTALRSHGNILRQALETSTAESESLMDGLTGRMMDNANQALKKMNDSNLLLQRVLETTTENLAEMESRVATQTSSYSSTVKDALGATETAGRLVGEHVGAFQATMTTMLEQFGALVSDLDRQATNIDQAGQSLQSAGNFSIDTLENRRGAMEALAESFTARADDIDSRMRTFAQSIAETVSQTEHRLSSARRAMEEALSSTSDAVAGQIETFANTADAEGRRTNEIVRTAQQQLLAEIEATMEAATKRFNDTAEAMRATAGQVGSELEATRNELQRGVLELPEETRASAAAMRRVVAEQIEALNELNNIVRSQPGTHDLSGRRAAPRVSETPRPAPQPAAAAPRQAAPQPERREHVAAAPAPRPVQRPAPSNPAPTQNASSSNGSQNGGWLRDVLRNASASQQAGAQASVNLSNLTRDIADAIDTNALSDAWQRYQAGESGVFSRRIYSLSGQSTYDEVRKRLQQDSEFASTASAYMSEFEQLLQGASNGANASRETHRLLVSDQGKVYTTLAHASGRLS